MAKKVEPVKKTANPFSKIRVNQLEAEAKESILDKSIGKDGKEAAKGKKRKMAGKDFVDGDLKKPKVSSSIADMLGAKRTQRQKAVEPVC